MAGVNKVILVGRVGKDPEVRQAGSTMVANFSMATSEKFKDKSGQMQESTEWHNIVVRNKAAEICEKYLNKGDKVYIEGRLKTRKWQDDKGNDRYSTEIQCVDFTFLTPKNDTLAPEDQAPQVTVAKATENNEEPNDLPF